MISHVQNFYCIIQTLNIITCSFLMPFIFQSFFHHLSLFILSFYHFPCLRLLIVCMTMILHTQVLASQRSWKCVLRLQSNLKLRAGLSALNYHFLTEPLILAPLLLTQNIEEHLPQTISTTNTGKWLDAKSLITSETVSCRSFSDIHSAKSPVVFPTVFLNHSLAGCSYDCDL